MISLDFTLKAKERGMRFFRGAVGLLALCFAFSVSAAQAEVTYSGIPGKWRKGSKSAKNAATEPAAPAKDRLPKKVTINDPRKKASGPKRG